MKLIINILTYLLKKSRQRITLMFIPHQDSHIYSLQLNYSIIFFISTLFLSLFFFASTAFYYQLEATAEREILIERYGSLLEYTVKVDHEVEANYKKLKEIKSFLKEIADHMSIPSKKNFDLDLFSNPLNKKTKKKENTNLVLSPRIDFLPPVYRLQKAMLFGKTYSYLLNSIHHRSEIFNVFYNMPMGRPFLNFYNLHDTSGFAKRIDPISRIGSEFHNGFDTAGEIGTPIYSTAPGWVQQSGYNEGYGNSIVVRHSNGYFSAYAHLSSIKAREGEYVQRGSRLGSMGKTGRVTGSHLHYEIRIGPHTRVNPLEYICAKDYTTTTCRFYHSKRD